MTNTTLLLIAILVIMLAAVPLVYLLKEFLPSQLEKSANLEQNENRIYVLHSEIHDAQSTLSGLTARRNQRSAENHRIDSETRRMEKQIREIENQPPLFVHEVGEPRANLNRFLADLSIAKSSGETRSAPVNPIWRCANVAEVWASTYEEAKQLVENAFPFKLGYNKTFKKQQPVNPPPKQQAAATDAAAIAAGGAQGEGETPAAAQSNPPPAGRELRRPSMSATAPSAANG